jgi:hypothetical protein
MNNIHVLSATGQALCPNFSPAVANPFYFDEDTKRTRYAQFDVHQSALGKEAMTGSSPRFLLRGKPLI